MRVVLADVPMYGDMNADLNLLASTYESIGVEVGRYRVPPSDATADSVFLRDVFAWTPFKFIRPQSLGKPSRRWESTAFFETCFPGEESRPFYYWLKEGCFEGADMLWPTLRHVMIGVGKRTSDAAAEEIVKWLGHLDEYCTTDTLYLPDWHEQHLLGLVNVVQGDQFYIDSRVRDECGENAPTWVEDAVVLPHEEYHQKHTNFVQYRQNIVINAGAVQTIAILESRGLTVIPVDIPALIANGGGVACTTGVWQP